jgi:ABC-type multidrug transport system fused ATPase/permease subunit
MYDLNSLVIVGILLLALLVAVEIGFRLGRAHTAAQESKRAQVNTIVGSLLGVLALLLGFTFSLALQRYDSRSEAVIHEANAIGTTILRADLLPEEFRNEAKRLLRDYLRVRVQAGAVSLDRQQDRAAFLAESASLQNAIWAFGVDAAAREPNPVTTGLFLQAVNELIDSYGTRDAALNRHVPEVVLFLLFGTFLVAACLVGYASGVAGHRASFATYALMVLIVCLVFIIIDLDRPRRGLIAVSQQSLVDLRDSFEQTPAGAAR